MSFHRSEVWAHKLGWALSRALGPNMEFQFLKLYIDIYMYIHSFLGGAGGASNTIDSKYKLLIWGLILCFPVYVGSKLRARIGTW